MLKGSGPGLTLTDPSLRALALPNPLAFAADPVSLITGIFNSGPSAAAKRAPFEVRAGSLLNGELQGIEFHGQENINGLYEYEVTVATEEDPDEIHTALFGAPACLTVKSPGSAPKVIQGIVSSLEALGGNAGEQGSDYHRYRLTIVPKLWLLKCHRVNRVFQGRTVMEIVETLLAITGMTPSEIRWRTADKEYPPLPFMYQRNESDFDFFRRVLASHGIFFYFEHANALPASMSGDAGASASVGVSIGGLGVSVSAGAALSPATSDGVTVLNFARRASDTPALAAAAPTTPTVGAFGVALSLPSISVGSGGSSGASASSGTLLFDDAMGTDSSDERVYEFGLKKQIRTQTLQLLERQVAKGANWVGQGAPTPSSAPASASAPSVSVSVGLGGASATASAGASVPFDVDTTKIPARVLREELYQVDANLTEATQDPKLIDNPQMDLELARARRQYLEARGKSDCRRIAAGYRFTLAGHTVPALNGEYTITGVKAEGYNPDFVKTDFVYRSSFTCIPSTYMPVPPRPKKRPKLGLEVAQVVAYKDILTVPWLESSPCGYVKVRFRWDVLDEQANSAEYLRSGTEDDYAVWVPVMQPWAGAGYGAQFIPREGMEVLVGFLEHQGERPVVLGCLYSAANPPPWTEQTDQQKVGIKSQTRAADGGYSEISIDDRQGGEVVTVKAQKDLAENVQNDRTTTIGNDRTETIGSDDSLTVTKDRSVQIGGNDSETVKGNAVRTVTGTETVTITGDSTATLSGNVTRTTQGTTTDSLQGDVSLTMGGALETKVAGTTSHAFADDYTERHLGHRAVVVGTGEAQRSAVFHVEGMGRAYASKSFEVEVLQSFSLICGASQLLISPTGITLSSPNISLVSKEVDVDAGTFAASATGALTLAGKTATMETAGAQIALDSSSASVTAAQVKLGPGSGALSQATVAPEKVTSVQMKDSTGKPRANARVLLTQGGKQRMTVLNANGMLELIGDSQYQISFPDDPVTK